MMIPSPAWYRVHHVATWLFTRMWRDALNRALLNFALCFKSLWSDAQVEQPRRMACQIELIRSQFSRICIHARAHAVSNPFDWVDWTLVWKRVFGVTDESFGRRNEEFRFVQSRFVCPKLKDSVVKGLIDSTHTRGESNLYLCYCKIFCITFTVQGKHVKICKFMMYPDIFALNS